MNYLGSIFAMVVCIAMSAYFSATETAFSSLNKTRLKVLADNGNKRAALALKLSNDYDKLIQLCDAVATDTGFVLPEQRFVGLVFKYGFNSFTIQKWKAVLQLKKDFSERLNEDVNLLLQSYQK